MEKSLVERIKKRDRWTCKVCGKRFVDLRVYGFINLDTCTQDYITLCDDCFGRNSDNVGLGSSLFTSLVRENKIILVGDCHGRFGDLNRVLSSEEPFDFFISVGDVGSLKDVTPQNLHLIEKWREKGYFVCLSDDTKVLTPNGWVTYDKVKVGDKVLGMIDKNHSDWVEVKSIQVMDFNGKMVQIENKVQKQLLTPDHFIVKLTKSKRLSYHQVREYLSLGKESQISIPMARELVSDIDATLSDDFVRLLAWVVTEGTYLKTGAIQIYQSNLNYANEIESILNTLGYRWSKYTDNRNKHYKVFYICVKDSKFIRNILPDKLDISPIINKLSKRQKPLFLNTFLKGDGYNNICYTSNERLAEQLVTMAQLIGISSTLSFRQRGRFKSYAVSLRKCKDVKVAGRDFSLVDYSGKVFDFTTSCGNFLAMRNGRPFFTGNCGNHDNVQFFNQLDVLQEIRGIKVSGLNGMLKSRTFLKDTPNNISFREVLYLSHLRDVDILVTHQPPTGLFNKVGESVFEEMLNYFIPKIYICGHVHRYKLKFHLNTFIISLPVIEHGYAVAYFQGRDLRNIEIVLKKGRKVVRV